MKPRAPRSGWRRAVGWAFLVAIAALVAVLATALAGGWTAFGKRARGDRRARMAASANWRGDHFVNPQPLVDDFGQTVRGLRSASPYTRPSAAVSVARGNAARFQTPPPSGLRVTWFGHSSTLVELDGYRVLIDPVWTARASPFASVGPEAFYPPPVGMDELPAIDAVVISHDHYDHLDQRTIVGIAKLAASKGWNTTFVVPLGVGAHLAYWGVPEAHIVELDWWQSTRILPPTGDRAANLGAPLRITCTPARHTSGRMIVDSAAKLWGGWALLGAHHRVYNSGDTGLFPAMREIGARLGPFDLALIEVGQYGRGWRDWHLGPEQAVAALQMVRGRVMLPVHWGKFALAYHGWTEPLERVLVAAAQARATILTPRPGQSVEPDSPPPRERWWPDVPWKTAAEEPIVSTQN